MTRETIITETMVIVKNDFLEEYNVTLEIDKTALLHCLGPKAVKTKTHMVQKVFGSICVKATFQKRSPVNKPV